METEYRHEKWASYRLTFKMVRIGILVGAPANLFFLSLATLGYEESPAVRVGTALLYLSCFPAARKEPTLGKIFFLEAVLFLTLPVALSYMAALNAFVPYWCFAFIFSAAVYSIFSKGLLAIALGPMGMVLGPVLYVATHPGATIQLPDFFPEALALVLLTYILVSGGKYFAELGFLSHLKLAHFQTVAAQEKANAAAIRFRAKALSAYIRPSLLRQVEARQDPREAPAQWVDKAVMLADLRGFSKTLVQLGPAQTQGYLNRYFGLVHAPIYRHSGEVDKLMGDATLAAFPGGGDALTAATEMRRFMQRFNAKTRRLGMPKLDNVICLCKGKILEGNFGDRHKLDFTFIGDAVTTCARMEPLAKTFGVSILMTEDILRDMPSFEDFRLIDIVRLKGVPGKVRLYEAFAHENPEVVNYKRKTKRLLEKALTIYFENKGIGDAYRLFQGMQAHMPQHLYDARRGMDPIIEYYLGRCRQWHVDPERWARAIESWDGCHNLGGDPSPADWTAIQGQSQNRSAR